MIKKLRIILGLIFVVALCAGLSACKKTEELDKYDVVIYYDSNGGSYYDRTGVTIVDGFNYSDYEANEDGSYSFKLIEPTSSARPGSITLTKPRSFFAGWYETRNDKRDANGNLLDDQDRPLVEKEGVYYVSGTENEKEPIISEPYYTYSGRWDFDKPFVCTPEDGKTEMRLYAGWVSYYFFDYYVREGNDWVKYGETYFNYDIVKPDSKYSDYNTIWVPDWKEGVMEHSSNYSDGTKFEFPKLSGHTFVAAYSDPSLAESSKIEKSYTHKGSLDVEHAKAIDSVQNIYVVMEEGEKFRIDKAEQLADSKNVKLNGHYTILKDLVFTDTVKWPSAFVSGTFTGIFTSEEGKAVTITGATATFASRTASYGGLFGRVGAGAVISGINFADATLDITATYNRQECYFGLFSGEISAKASVSAVTVWGTVKLGQIVSDSVCSVNMLVNGDNKNGVSLAPSCGINLQAYGNKISSYYSFSVKPEETAVAANGDVTLAFTQNRTERQKDNEIYDITTWRQ